MTQAAVSQRQPKSFSLDLIGIVEQRAQSLPDAIAFENISQAGRDVYSWRRLLQEVAALSGNLSQIGVSADDRVAILMENHPRWCIAFLAIQSVGAVAVPLDTISSPAAATSVIIHAEAAFVVASPNLYATALSIREDISSAVHIFGSESEWADIEDEMISRRISYVPRTGDDDLAILYTGGTTGRPKGVLLTQRNVYRTIVDMMAVFPLSPSDRILSILPLFHIMPLLANLIAPVYTGARVVFLGQLEPAKVISTFSNENITAFLCVPLFYYQVQRRILEEVARQPMLKRWLFSWLLTCSGILRDRFGIRMGKRLFSPIHAKFGSGLRAFGIGGARFNVETARFFADLGFNLFQAYGMTECAGVATVTPLDRNGGLTCGKPAAHVEVRVVNQDAEGVGEIVVRGENVMKGYWRDIDATNAAIQDGWLHTGDLGSFNSDGFLCVTGRIKEVIVLSSGKNVFPEEIEELFRDNCQLIQDVCIIGVEGPEGDRLHCLAVPNLAAFRDLQISSIEHHIRSEIQTVAQRLPSFKRPTAIQILNQPLPRTSTRKLQRFKAAELARDSAVSKTSIPFSIIAKRDDPIEHEIVTLIQRLDGSARGISRSTSLELDLGLDSLQRAELIANIERSFAVSITRQQAASFFKVGDLIDSIMANPKADAVSEEVWIDWKTILMEPLTADERNFIQQYLSPKPISELFWFAVFRAIRFAAFVLLRMRLEQKSLFPSGGFLLCPNHISYLDDILLPASLPLNVFRRSFFFGASKYFANPILAKLGRTLRVIPVDSDAHLIHALRMGCEGVKAGMVLCVFPEGTRSFDGKLQKLMRGPAIIAQSLGVPVVPVGITGTHSVLPRASGFGGFHRVGIAIGEPIASNDWESVTAFNARLSQQITAEARRAAEIIA